MSEGYALAACASGARGSQSDSSAKTQIGCMVAARRDARWLRVIASSRTDRASAAVLFEKSWRVNVATGTVKKVISDRGFGFITADDAKEYFFHRDALDSTLNFDRLVGGEKVEFQIEQSPRGPRASRVHAA